MRAQGAERARLRLAPVVHHHLVHDVGERELDRAHRAVGDDAGTRLDPLGLQQRLGLHESRGFDDDVGTAHAGLPVVGGHDLHAEIVFEPRLKGGAAFRTPRVHANLVEVKDRVQQPHVPVGRAASADVRQHLRVLLGQVPGADRRDGAGAHVGDVGGVDHGDRHARLRIEQVEDGQLRRQADLVVAIEVAHHLDARQAERADVAAQHVEVTGVVLLGHQVHARLEGRLVAALRQQALLDGADDLGVGHGQRLHIGVVEVVQEDVGHGYGPAAIIGRSRPCCLAAATAPS